LITRLDVAARLSLALLLAGIALPGVANAANVPIAHKIGSVTWHAARFVNQDLALSGYLLLRADGYVLFSDEPSGAISAHDLPVTGHGIDTVVPNVRYIISGHFVHGGLVASNGNPYHLELTAVPTQVH